MEQKVLIKGDSRCTPRKKKLGPKQRTFIDPREREISDKSLVDFKIVMNQLPYLFHIIPHSEWKYGLFFCSVVTVIWVHETQVTFQLPDLWIEKICTSRNTFLSGLNLEDISDFKISENMILPQR